MPRILIIDDEETVRSMFSMTLRTPNCAGIFPIRKS